MPQISEESRRELWESRTELPLSGLALAFLGAYAWPILEPSIRGTSAQTLCDVVTTVAWLAFVVDYAARLWLTQERVAFIRGHVLDLAAVVLPVLRPLRLLRLVSVLDVLNRRAGASLRGRVAIYVATASALVVFVAALAELDAERGHANANIDSFGDALWWAATTVTTVGYGDQFPVTTTGRFIAAGLMLAGIALLGVVTASVASWLIQRVSEVEEQSSAVTARDMAALSAQLDRVERRFEELTSTSRPEGDDA